jgi:hypothetical protein
VIKGLHNARCKSGNLGRVGRELLPHPIYIFHFAFWISHFFFCLLAGSVAFAADPPPANDDYDRALLGDPARPDAKGPADESMQTKLQHELGSAARREGTPRQDDKPKSPLLLIAEEMRGVAPRLGNRDSGKVTQYLQQQIVADLDKVIEEAKKSEPKNNRLSPVGKAHGGGPKSKDIQEQVDSARAPVAS